MALPGAPPKPPKATPKTQEWRKWKGVNKADSRVAIGDDEFSWLENYITVGDGAVQGLAGPGADIATIAAGPHTIWGFTLNSNPVIITINADGSATQVAVPSGTTTAICGAGIFSGSHDTHLANWQGSRILFVDPVAGYYTWDGTTFTLISALQVGASISVFEGRVWIASGRTIKYTAPATYNDFTAGNGAGSTILTDEAFDGNIVALISALEELWIIGQDAVEALANVTASGTAPNVLTSFSITNIVTNLGTNAPHSVIGYLRALAFLAPFGAYALSGVTPQKLSAKIDGLFDSLTIGDSISSAVAVVQNLLCLLFLVPYTGTEAQSSGGTPCPLLLCFAEGKWCFAVQRTTCSWVTSVVVGGVAQAWATDGFGIYRVFGAAVTEPVPYKIQLKLYNFDGSTNMHAMTKVGVEVQAPYSISPTLTIDSEAGSEVVPAAFANLIIWVNGSNQVVQWQNGTLQDVNWISSGLILSRADSAQFGRYLGCTITGNDPPYRLQAMAFEYATTRAWDTN